MKCLLTKPIYFVAGPTSLLALSFLANAQETQIVLSEEQVKSTIEEIATLYICSDKSLLDSANVDYQKCVIGVSTFAESCWAPIDKLVDGYELPGNEQGKVEMDNITEVYIRCLEAKLLKTWIGRQDRE